MPQNVDEFTNDHFFSPACLVRSGLREDVRPKDDLYPGVSHHHLPGGLLCVGELRGGQREDEVNHKTTQTTNSCESLCMTPSDDVQCEKLSASKP